MSKNPKSSEQLLSEITSKLDQIIAVLAIQGKDEDTQIRLLKKRGFQAIEIEKLLGISGKVKDRKNWKET